MGTLIVDGMLVAGGLGVLMLGFIIRKVSGAMYRSSEYVYNTGVMTTITSHVKAKTMALKMAAAKTNSPRVGMLVDKLMD